MPAGVTDVNVLSTRFAENIARERHSPGLGETALPCRARESQAKADEQARSNHEGFSQSCEDWLKATQAVKRPSPALCLATVLAVPRRALRVLLVANLGSFWTETFNA